MPHPGRAISLDFVPSPAFKHVFAYALFIFEVAESLAIWNQTSFAIILGQLQL
ncbi:unnamed protein product, partial [Prunus brigantina]